MPIVKSIINKHNKIVLDPPTNNSKGTCNCINRKKCPLQQKWLTSNIMYKATLTSNQDNYQHKICYGITETKFKQQYANHIKSFSMRSIKATLNFQMNYGVLKTVTTVQMSYEKYFESTRRITLTPKDVPCV